jgi:hypothetical protein
MAKLTQKERDALPASDFAVPGKRELPMHNEEHVRLAWDMVNRTKDLTPEEKKRARERILERAKKFGIDTREWQKQEAGSGKQEAKSRQFAGVRFEAMALELPEVSGHPNRAPFSGVLLRVNEPSDYAVGGADGHRTFIPKEAAEKALPSLLGMGVDFKATLDGHDPKKKIGLITGDDIDRNALTIEGFFYAKDFPEEVALIREEKDLLGFSYEADVRVRDMDEDPWVIEEITFTGAAVLYKADAAYTTTSLAAQAEKESAEMEELKKLLGELGKRLEKLEAAQTSAQSQIEANKAIMDKVHPHAEACKACAEACRAEGIGLHATRGHVAVLHKIAHHMETEAAQGRMPHELPSSVFHDTNWMYAMQAGAEGETKKLFEGIKAEIESIGTQMKDLQAKAFEAAANPGRKTLTPEITALLNKTGLLASIEKGELNVEDVDRTLEAAGIKGRAAIEAKLKLAAGGLLPMGKAA